MMHEEMLARLRSKDNRASYAYAVELMEQSARSSALYAGFDGFLSLLSDGSGYVRTRGCMLCCAQARWDTQGKLAAALPRLLALLNDPKPTVVRQCPAALREAAVHRPELLPAIRKGLEAIDLSRYSESMAPLIEKDAKALLEMRQA